MKRGAFTLVELVVVLAVIAVLTHLAVRELAHLRDGRLSDAADRQLEEIKSAVYSVGPDGIARGFLVDMGRLPKAEDGTLSELWLMPTGTLRYAVRPATEENLVPEARGKGLSKDSVFVPTGWKGPYLRLPFGVDHLRDPWGNPIEAEDDAGLPRVFTTNGFVTAVAHYGPSARAAGERRHSFFPEEREPAGRLVVSLESASTGAVKNNAKITLYSPVNGLISAIETNITESVAVFEGVMPGRKVLFDSVTDGAHAVDVAPGDNLIVVKIP